MRLLPSAELITEARRTTQSDVISVSDVLRVLRLQLTVAECDVFAYPSIESDVIVIVMPVTASPTPLQVSTNHVLLLDAGQCLNCLKKQPGGFDFECRTSGRIETRVGRLPYAVSG